MKQKEFNKIVLPLAPKIYSYSYRILDDKDEAKDVVQDVMLKLWLKRKDLKGYYNPAGFIMRMTRNYCIDLIRKRKNILSDNEGHIDIFEQSENNHTAEANDTFTIIRNIIKTLPPSQQEVIILKDLEDYKTDEIAEITGLGINNIRTILSRCRKQIREELISKYQITSCF